LHSENFGLQISFFDDRFPVREAVLAWRATVAMESKLSRETQQKRAAMIGCPQ